MLGTVMGCTGKFFPDLAGHHALTLRPKIITLAHQGHLGIVKAKQLLRSKCFWLGMD